MMWKNYFKIAWRNMLKKKLRTLIHLLGLSIGMAICFLIYNILSYSYSFDTFHPRVEDIYRIHTKSSWKEESWENSGTPVPLAGVIKDEVPGIEEAAYFQTHYRSKLYLLESGKDIQLTGKVIYADDSYFSIFPRQWIAGNATNALKEPNQLVLSESAAQNYFPNTDASDILGKNIRYINQEDTLLVSVSGVVADFKGNTDFTFTDMISLASLAAKHQENMANEENWNSVNSSSQLFVRLHPQTNLSAVQTALDKIVEKYVKSEEHESTQFFPSHLSELHFTNAYFNQTANKETLKGLALIGLAILLLACFNFVNLETAHAINRAKEVGIRKTLGSSKAQLNSQFMIETLVYVLISLLISFAITEGLFISFKEYMPEGMGINYWSLHNLLFAAILCFFLTLLSGFYPAIVLNSYRPDEALKGSSLKKQSFSLGNLLRKNLTIIQFSLSIMFIIYVLVVHKQLQYVSTQHLGFEKENLIYAVALPYKQSKNELLKGEAAQLPYVTGISLSNSPISSRSLWTSTVKVELDSSITEHSVQIKKIDDDYLDVHKVNLIAGLPLSHGKNECLVNEAFVKKIGFSSPDEAVGSFIEQSEKIRIAGVVNNFHSRTLKEEILPLVIFKTEANDANIITLRLAKGTPINTAKDELNALYKKVYPQDNYEFKFLEEELEVMYAEDQKMRKILAFTTFVAILISCLGLFGLASWTINRRIKEISIRKVLGASLGHLFQLVGKEYLIVLSLSFILGGSLAYYLTSDWLETFVYRINMPWGLFLAAATIALLLAGSIVAWHTYRAAQKDPAEILGSE